MQRQGEPGFPYFLGIRSLSEVASTDDSVVVLNALGGESRAVTPVSHAYSGGNVVYGVSAGKGGQLLRTPKGDIPIYNTVLEGLQAGHSFNTGVVYLPPSGVRDGVAELVRINKDLRKIIIVTEKIAVHDAREIRAIAQANGVDIIGGNCLGVADSWNRVRIGGALGGLDPAETLLKGSVALFSNSGGFTTTIAQYLATEGWGTTTLISSGKDVYIHYSAADFAHAFANDTRSKAAVLYVEPGGYYEQNIAFEKPVVACIVGRWKSKLTRAVGHAGAMAGSGDSAEDKEAWFFEAFGVDGVFTPTTPLASNRGAVVRNISDIPAALSAVMKLNDVSPDFETRGSLALKPWLSNNQGLPIPADLSLPDQNAPEPYGTELRALKKQVGAIVARQSMKDRSGASKMDPKSQITSVHGTSVLDLAQEPLEAVYALPFVHEIADTNMRAMLGIAIAAEVNLEGTPALMAAQAAREAGNTPNVVMSSAVSVTGPENLRSAIACSRRLIDLFGQSELTDGADTSFDYSGIELDAETLQIFADHAPTQRSRRRVEAMIEAVSRRGGKSVFLEFLLSQKIELSQDALLAAISLTLGWSALIRKKITRRTLETLPGYLRLYGVMIGASIPEDHHAVGALFGIEMEDRYSNWSMDDLCFRAITGRKPIGEEAVPLQLLIGLLTSNGPGAITAQGAKGAVSADGPQTPERVLINKAMMGFLTHCGYSHGGNGFEGVALLLDAFNGIDLEDPSNRDHGIDLTALAEDQAAKFKRQKLISKQQGAGTPSVPGVHHPVFRGQTVNYDPRERYVKSFLDSQGKYNIFLEFYHEFVRALHRAGASPYVFCVNVDAVISSLLLAMMWGDYKTGIVTNKGMEEAAFTVFLYGRMIGAAAEIDDHINRGKNMDTRTPISQCQVVT